MVRSITFIVLFTLLLVGSGKLRGLVAPDYSMLVYGTLGSLAAYGLACWFMRREGKSLAVIGMAPDRWTGIRFGLGVLIGTVLFGMMVGALVLLAGLELRRVDATLDASFWLAYLPILPLALMEEIGFRSYAQVKLYEKHGIWVSQVVCAVLFGLYHVAGGWSFASAFWGPFVWAFIFGAGALWSGGIGVSLGIHFIVNVLQLMMGMKGGVGRVWELVGGEGVDTYGIGMGIHVVLLLVGISASVRTRAKTRRDSFITH